MGTTAWPGVDLMAKALQGPQKGSTGQSSMPPAAHTVSQQVPCLLGLSFPTCVMVAWCFQTILTLWPDPEGTAPTVGKRVTH